MVKFETFYPKFDMSWW